MKRNALMAIASLMAVSLIVLGQIGCQPAADTNRSDSTAATSTNSGREVVDLIAIESELLRIENDWPRVIKEKDVAAVRRVEAEDAVFIYPDGSVGDKAQDVKDMEAGNMSADSIEMADLKVKVLDADAALVSGRSIIKGGKYKTPDGKTLDITGEYRFVDTFARRDGQWKLVAGVSVPVRQPAASASPAAKASPAAIASPAAKTSPAVKASPAMKASPAPTASPVMKASPAPTASPVMKTTP